MWLYADIDECLDGTDTCSNANCVNQAGNFTCQCFDGFAHVDMFDLQSPCSEFFINL